VRVVVSSRTDVYENLAAEELLLDSAPPEPVVFVYRNDAAVVIGKNQNPWRECAVSRLDALGVKLARRITGGGTVFHDPGNLNIACILPRAMYRRDEVLRLTINGLARLGVAAEITGSTSLAVDGRKISGNAFCYRRDHVLHHGTLLWEADLEKLRAALVPDLPDIETRAVASNPMPVINLCDRLPGLTIEMLAETVIAAMADAWETPVREDDLPDVGDQVAKLKTWDWLFGATPDFSYQTEDRSVQVHRGRNVTTGERFSSR
jgi:lipoate-protein ligase A